MHVFTSLILTATLWGRYHYLPIVQLRNWGREGQLLAQSPTSTKWSDNCGLSVGWLAISQGPNHSTRSPLLVCLPVIGEQWPHQPLPMVTGAIQKVLENCNSIKSQPHRKHKTTICHHSVLEFSRQNECWFFFFVLFFVVVSRSHNITSVYCERMTLFCHFQEFFSPPDFLRIGDPQNSPLGLSGSDVEAAQSPCIKPTMNLPQGSAKRCSRDQAG